MIRFRSFKSEFSCEIYSCKEDDVDGVYYTIRRFEQFILTLNKKINEDNEKILEEVKGEDEDVAISILNQDYVRNSLYFFNDLILKSFITSIYSYFEYKLEQFSKISENHLNPNKKIESFKKNLDGKTVSDIDKYVAFLTSEIIPDLIKFQATFDKINLWKDIRKLIVHKNSNFDTSKIDESNFKSIKEESGIIKITGVEDIIDFLSQIKNYLDTIVDLLNEKYKLVEYSN